MQAQYGPNPRKMREIVSEMYTKYGWRQGIMRGFWVSWTVSVGPAFSAQRDIHIADHCIQGDSSIWRLLCWVRDDEAVCSAGTRSASAAGLGDSFSRRHGRFGVLDSMVSLSNHVLLRDLAG